MEITTLMIYKDPGYVENGIEKPGTDDVLPSPYFESTTISYYPGSKEIFRRLKIKLSYEDLIQCSYLKMIITGSNGRKSTYYGWIDSIEYATDDASDPVTIVNWHVDPWRTYLGSAVFGAGVITRRTADDTIPPQDYSHQYVQISDSNVLINNDTSGVYWIIMNVNCKLDSTEEYSGIRTITFPVAKSGQPLYISDGSTAYLCPTIDQLLQGNIAKYFGIDQANVYGAWISPIAPCTVIPETIGGHYCYDLSGNWLAYKRNSIQGSSSSYGWFVRIALSNAYIARLAVVDPTTPATTIHTSDTEAYVITDFDGQPIGTLPWGMKINAYSYRVVVADTSAYISIRFLQGSSDDPIEAPSEGLEINIPLKSMPIPENAYSAYIYSGQAEYDRVTMEVNRNSTLQSGIAGTANSGVQGALSGAIMGGMAGAVGGPIGIGAGAAIGAVTSMLGQAISTGADYAISGDTNAKLLEATKTYQANQANSLMLPGSGVDWIIHGQNISIITLEWDAYSKAQRQADIDQYGAHVYEPKSDCSDLIAAKGPIQIRNLIVTGSIPPYVKQYFINIFDKGVVIK